MPTYLINHRFDHHLLREYRAGRLNSDKWLLGGSTAALRWISIHDCMLSWEGGF